MIAHDAAEFANYLGGKGRMTGVAAAHSNTGGNGRQGALRRLWQSSGLSAGDFADEVARFYGLPRISLPQLLAGSPAGQKFSRRFLREMDAFPYQHAKGSFRLAIADPGDTACVRAAEIVLGAPVEIEVASFDDIATALAEKIDGDEVPLAGPEVETRFTRGTDDDDDIDNLRDLASGAPVVHAVNDLLEKAAELRASDIHVEPFRNGLAVRMRVDGMLRAEPAPAGVLAQAVISRIKILAGLNIAERRLPQDGAARVRVARTELDIRVAIMPTQHGESAVIRLLPRDRGILSIDKLGFSGADDRTISRLLKLPHGMIVVTGPTGSGKTTTLATMISLLNEATRKILTIEDPVEYEIQGVSQSQVKPAIGLTFATALRAFVRQDPDVIMVGEVRDAETAHIAIHAALTGHLVLTTLHTETAAAAIPRLLDLGVESFLLKSTLRAVVAQRLVRQLCEHCKRRRQLRPTDLAADPRFAAVSLAVGETIHDPQGCERCGGTGYRGRVGIFEILELTDDLRRLIGAETDAATVDRAAAAAGMTTMIEDGAAKCRSGMTSPAEVLRVATIR